MSDKHWAVIEAAPEDVYDAIRTLDLSGNLQIKILFGLRGLPRILTGRGIPRTVNLDSFFDLGFVLLVEERPREVVLGAVGRFWRPDSGIEPVAPERFVSFDEPGFAKGALNFRVQPAGRACVLSTETRVHGTDEGARRAFLRYWRVIGPFSGYIRRILLREVKHAAEAESAPASASAG